MHVFFILLLALALALAMNQNESKCSIANSRPQTPYITESEQKKTPWTAQVSTH